MLLIYPLPSVFSLSDVHQGHLTPAIHMQEKKKRNVSRLLSGERQVAHSGTQCSSEGSRWASVLDGTRFSKLLAQNRNCCCICKGGTWFELCRFICYKHEGWRGSSKINRKPGPSKGQLFRKNKKSKNQKENSQAATNRLSPVITEQQELGHRLLFVNGDVLVPTCARNLEWLIGSGPWGRGGAAEPN